MYVHAIVTRKWSPIAERKITSQIKLNQTLSH